MNALKARRVAVLLAVVLGSASAAVPAPRPTANMVTGSTTSQPIGHYEFCQRHADECNIRFGSTTPAKVTSYGWDMIHQVNSSVNHRITPKTDMEVYGQENTGNTRLMLATARITRCKSVKNSPRRVFRWQIFSSPSCASRMAKARGIDGAHHRWRFRARQPDR